MYTKVEKIIDTFTTQYIDKKKTLLVAFSGGADSFALLLALSKIPGLSLAVAHVDHCWRESSRAEAEYLKEVVDELGYPFHLKTLDPHDFSGNLENYCRECRYNFFSELIEKYGYQGVALGHHADDQVETVLKRVLEGATFTKLSGIESVKQAGAMKLLRPLISISKKEILDYMELFSYRLVNDSSNEDSTFLRARMRVKILPLLSQYFGKNISSSLIGISQESKELRGYLDCQIEKYFNKIVIGPMGICLDLSEARPKHPLEMKYIIKKMGETLSLSLPKKIVENLSELIYSNVANKKVFFEQVEICVDRGFVFFFKQVPEEFAGPQSLILNSQKYGSWKINVEVVDGDITAENKIGWENIWKGELSVCIPKEDYLLSPYIPNLDYRNKSSLSKWLGNHKVPMCLRAIVPTIIKSQKVEYEFFTDKKKLGSYSEKEIIKLSLSLELD